MIINLWLHSLFVRMRLGVLLLVMAALPLSSITYGEENGLSLVDDVRVTSQLARLIPRVSRAEAIFESPGQLIINNGFENSKSIGVFVPGKFGEWSGDQTAVVGPEQGIEPWRGKRMLRMLGSGPWGTEEHYTTCEVFQLVDLSKYRDLIDADKIKLTATLHVNRVHHSKDTDTAFSFKAYACDGSPSNFHHKFLHNETVGEAGSHIHADKNPETWEGVQFSMRIPRGTTYVGIGVVAGENVSNDATDEFHGHYVDGVSMKILPR